MAISMDMKYTALYWALRFVENELDVHVKEYSGYKIIIDAEKQMVNYGDKIKVLSNDLRFLKRHKDFVVLECVDRLLLKGYKPIDIVLDGRVNCPDIVLNGNIEIYCEQWGKDYLSATKTFSPERNNSIFYTSRLVSGLLEYKNIIKVDNDVYNYGLFEPNVPLYSIIPRVGLNKKFGSFFIYATISPFSLTSGFATLTRTFHLLFPVLPRLCRKAK